VEGGEGEVLEGGDVEADLLAFVILSQLHSFWRLIFGVGCRV
jgi:hypothetical protein